MAAMAGEGRKVKSIRRGIAAIIFRRGLHGPEFLIMHRILRWRGWETLKGGRRPGESPRQTLARELKEELDISPQDMKVLGTIPSCRINFKIPARFKEQMGGFDYALYQPFFLVELSTSVRPSLRKDEPKEHDHYMFVPYEKALKMLTYGNTRAALRKAAKLLAGRCRCRC